HPRRRAPLPRGERQGAAGHRRVRIRPAVRGPRVPPDVRRAEPAGQAGAQPPGPGGGPVAAGDSQDRGDLKAMPALNDLVEDVNAFRNYLRAERGMADNTVIAYGH